MFIFRQTFSSLPSVVAHDVVNKGKSSNTFQWRIVAVEHSPLLQGVLLKAIPDCEDSSLIHVQLIVQPPTAVSFGRPGALSGAQAQPKAAMNCDKNSNIEQDTCKSRLYQIVLGDDKQPTEAGTESLRSGELMWLRSPLADPASSTHAAMAKAGMPASTTHIHRSCSMKHWLVVKSGSESI
jgi:hypothetical protein